jgi:hypothetical protein
MSLAASLGEEGLASTPASRKPAEEEYWVSLLDVPHATVISKTARMEPRQVLDIITSNAMCEKIGNSILFWYCHKDFERLSLSSLAAFPKHEWTIDPRQCKSKT